MPKPPMDWWQAFCIGLLVVIVVVGVLAWISTLA